MKGFGQIAIAKKLNAEGRVSPRAQQGRPHAWAPSSVREVLYRDLYRGVMVWNRTKKRDTWGQVKQRARPQDEWLRVPVPKLRIINDNVWNKAHARLGQTRDAYLRTTGGRLWGRPLDGGARKYLLTGLARCGCCGGSLEVRSRRGSDGQERIFYYACSSYWRRGKAVCANRLELPLRAADDAVVDALQKELLTPAFVDLVVGKVLTRSVSADSPDDTRARLTQQIADLSGELDRLVEGLARAGASSSVTTAIKKREATRARLEAELHALDRHDDLSHTQRQKLETLASEKAKEWKSLLWRHTPQARQILAKMLRDKLVFRPEAQKGYRGYRFSREGTITWSQSFHSA